MCATGRGRDRPISQGVIQSFVRFARAVQQAKLQTKCHLQRVDERRLNREKSRFGGPALILKNCTRLD